MSYKNIMKIIPSLQAVALAKENIRTVKKKKIKTEDMIDMGAKNIIGTNLIKINADLIGGL